MKQAEIIKSFETEQNEMMEARKTLLEFLEPPIHRLEALQTLFSAFQIPNNDGQPKLFSGEALDGVSLMVNSILNEILDVIEQGDWHNRETETKQD